MDAHRDPLFEKQKGAAETLDRRRKVAHDVSVRVAADRSDFFYRLSLLSGGALTFSVAWLGYFAPLTTCRLMLIYASWLFLLTSLCACLIRNLSHQGYLFADVASKRIESEIAYIDVDSELITTHVVAYSESSENFDRHRELRINKENRELWQEELKKHQPFVDRYWKRVKLMEGLATSCVFVGFLLLIIFAVVNSYIAYKNAPTKPIPTQFGY